MLLPIRNLPRQHALGGCARVAADAQHRLPIGPRFRLARKPETPWNQPDLPLDGSATSTRHRFSQEERAISSLSLPFFHSHPLFFLIVVDFSTVHSYFSLARQNLPFHSSPLIHHLLCCAIVDFYSTYYISCLEIYRSFRHKTQQAGPAPTATCNNPRRQTVSLTNPKRTPPRSLYQPQSR